MSDYPPDLVVDYEALTNKLARLNQVFREMMPRVEFSVALSPHETLQFGQDATGAWCLHIEGKVVSSLHNTMKLKVCAHLDALMPAREHALRQHKRDVKSALKKIDKLLNDLETP
jgi:hypothetical protein